MVRINKVNATHWPLACKRFRDLIAAGYRVKIEGDQLFLVVSL